MNDYSYESLDETLSRIERQQDELKSKLIWAAVIVMGALLMYWGLRNQYQGVAEYCSQPSNYETYDECMEHHLGPDDIPGR